MRRLNAGKFALNLDESKSHPNDTTKENHGQHVCDVELSSHHQRRNKNKPQLNGITNFSKGTLLSCQTPADAKLLGARKFATFRARAQVLQRSTKFTVYNSAPPPLIMNSS
jgi:hypothetical protein